MAGSVAIAAALLASIWSSQLTRLVSANVTCAEDQFACATGDRCVPVGWRCDHSPDCEDSSDEPVDCPRPACQSGQFECAKTRQCVPLGWLCDGENDCGLADNLAPDTSDEDARRCHRGKSCGRNYFRCDDGLSCRRLATLCDEVADCPDRSDEGEFCANATAVCDGIGCRHGCKPTRTGPVCYCPTGQEPDGVDCVDTNECHVDGFCDQICRNNATAYECDCVDGYALNGSRCLAINDPDDTPATIIFTNSLNIEQIYLNGSQTPAGGSTGVGRESLALDYSFDTHTACWIAHNETDASMRCAPIGNLSATWTIAGNSLFALTTVKQMAHDWLARNWYFLDDTREMIFACNESLTACLVVIDAELCKPRALALDPTRGYLFLTEWGSTAPLLERARLDGSDRTRLVERKIVYPYGVALDFPREHVYWVDAYLDFIERVDYDGRDRRTIIRGAPVRNLYGVAIFERYVYATSWHTDSIIAVNKFNQTDIRVVRSNLTRPFSIHVYHRQRQPLVGGGHPCSRYNGGCDHLCIPHYAGVSRRPLAVCRCVAGHRLTRGGQCAAAKQSQLLLYARGRPGGIKGMTLELQTTKAEEAMVPITGLSRPTALDFDARTRQIYYSDVQRFAIERQTVDGTRREPFLDKGLNNCEGLAVDWMGRNLYWTDEGLLAIFVARLDSSAIKKRLIHGNMSHPRAIVVDPKRGYLYWSDWSMEQTRGEVHGDDRPATPTSGRIERAFMNGGSRETLVDTDLQWPNGLSLDYADRKLYWCDAYLHRIERIDLDGSHREIVFEGEKLDHPYGLVHYDGFIFWTEFQRGIVQRLNLKTKEVVEMYAENPPLFEIRLFDNSTQSGSNDCTDNNGNCEDLCLSTPAGTLCACRDGYSVGANKTNCEITANYTEPSRCKDGEFECVKNLRCIDVRYICDGDNDCADGSDEDSTPGGRCAEVTCRSDQFRCDSNRCISAHWVCDGELDCHDGADEEPIRRCRNATCSASQFTCKTSGRCIPATWTCDSDPDCGDGDRSDEHDQCAYPECEQMDFRCRNKRCVPLEYVCDGDDDCRDSSDELDCHLSCNASSQFACDAGQKCLHAAYRCNGVWDCNDGSDEENCFKSTYNKTIPATPLCHASEFGCKSGDCIPKSWLCDRKLDCLDGSDEIGCNASVECDASEFKCSNGHCIDRTKKCDQRSDCADGSDEHDCPPALKSDTVHSARDCHPCEDGPNRTVCMDLSRLCGRSAGDCFANQTGGLCNGDRCPSVDCPNLCANIAGHPGFACFCENGTQLNGQSATDSLSCSCAPDFTGAYCQPLSVGQSCAELRCANGSECVLNAIDGRPYCRCPPGRSGHRCQIDSSTNSNTTSNCELYCFNGGTCALTGADETSTPVCSCSPGFAGQRCQIILLSQTSDMRTAGSGVVGGGGESGERSTSWLLIAVIPAAAILTLSLALYVGVAAVRLGLRSRAFAHRRMEETGGHLEICNTVFDGGVEEFDGNTAADIDRGPDLLSVSFTIDDIENSTNFTNPLYENGPTDGRPTEGVALNGHPLS